jgi:hypothetical protein
MNKTIFVFILFGFFSSKVRSQSVNYDPGNISALISKNASVVVRSENIEFVVTDIDRAKIHVHRIITILNEQGAKALLFHEQTDKFESLDDVEIKLLNNDGAVVENYKQNDLNIVSFGEGLIDDAKDYYKQLHATRFPVTIEVTFSKKYKGILNYPNYQILVSGRGIEQSVYTAKIIKRLDLRYKEINIHLPPVVSEDDKYKIYTWSVKNLAPVKFEEGSVSYEGRYPCILLAPSVFELDDYKGNMSSWKDFGYWYANLGKGTNILPKARIDFFAQLVSQAKTDKEKIRIVYEYLQNNFRYVSIQLGIGGYKPISAQFTDEKKYGDCKGLSNYIQTVLNYLNIGSYQALINAGYNSEPIDPSFPCNLFNHVILCVPLKNDTVWLECTSKTTDFGTLGSFTENKNALLITENGGVLIPTPKSNVSANFLNAYTIIDLKEDGSGTTATRIAGTGEFKEELFAIKDEKADLQKDYIMNNWGFKDPGNITFSQGLNSGNFELWVKQESSNIPDLKTSNKMFLAPWAFKLWSVKLPKSEERTQDFYFNYPFEKSDTTVLNLPTGYKPEALPTPKNAKNYYATYTNKFWYDDKKNQVYSVVFITLLQNRIPARDYGSVKNFFDKILIDNSEKIVIAKSE